MMSMDQFVAQAGLIPYQYRHPHFLYSLVKWLRPVAIVEVGTHLGMSAVWIARGLQENHQGGKLFCIDPFCWVQETQEQQWVDNINRCGVFSCVELIKGRSQEVAWPGKIDMAFIDGNHVYDVCRHDVEKAQELGATCIAMHDTVSWEGSRKYSEEFRYQNKDWDCLEGNFDDGLLVAVKRQPKGECRGQDIGEQWDKPS